MRSSTRNLLFALLPGSIFLSCRDGHIQELNASERERIAKQIHAYTGTLLQNYSDIALLPHEKNQFSRIADQRPEKFARIVEFEKKFYSRKAFVPQKITGHPNVVTDYAISSIKGGAGSQVIAQIKFHAIGRIENGKIKDLPGRKTIQETLALRNESHEWRIATPFSQIYMSRMGARKYLQASRH